MVSPLDVMGSDSPIFHLLTNTFSLCACISESSSHETAHPVLSIAVTVSLSIGVTEQI